MPATPDGGAVLGFDVGTRFIGIAVGSALTGRARALRAVAAGDWARIDAAVADWQPARLVVGLPLALDGAEQPMSRTARAFAAELARRYARPVEFADERHSSREAAGRFAAARAEGRARRKDAAAIDALAAAVILETWLGRAAAAAPSSPDEPDGPA